jgi:hypothetical protein
MLGSPAPLPAAGFVALPRGLVAGLDLLALTAAAVGLVVGLAASKSFSDGLPRFAGLVLRSLPFGGLTLRFGDIATFKVFPSVPCPVARRFESRLNLREGFLR